MLNARLFSVSLKEIPSFPEPGGSMTRTLQRIFTILFIFSTFCASTSFSQDERVRREDPFDREAMLKRFDADGDGDCDASDILAVLAVSPQ